MKKLTALLLIFACCILTGCMNLGDEYMNMSELSSSLFTKNDDVNVLHTESEATNNSEVPVIVFLVRSDISNTLSEMDVEEIVKDNIAVKSLGFYDMNGNYYTSTDPDLNALDNIALISEYKAGHITEQIQHYTNCDVNVLTKQYKKLNKIYQSGLLEIMCPNELPTVQAESITWYGYYFDQDGNIQYQTIHRKESMTDLYTDNDTVNEVYDWIIKTFIAADRS